MLAVTDRAAHTHGMSAFVVEKDTKGFRPGKKENKLGLRASDTAELIFEDCVIPAENLLGGEGQGFPDAMRVLDGGRISIAALSLGMAEGAYEAALKYSKQRKQFGKAIMLKSIFFAALLICVANPYRSLAQCIPSKDRSLRTEFFSTVEVVKDVGPSGSELQMEEEADRVVATLREYRGDIAPRETKLQGLLRESGTAGTVAKCTVRLSGRDRRGPVHVEGEITLARFRGSVTRYIAKKPATYQISLRRQRHEYEYTVAAALSFLSSSAPR